MSRTVVFDTNVLSYAFRNDTWHKAVKRMTEEHRAVISFQTYEELWHGAFKARWGPPRVRELRSLLGSFELHHTDNELALRCAQLRADQERRGLPLSVADAWIVATALALDCPLVTYDQRLRRAEVPGLVVWGVVGEAGLDEPLRA